MNAAVKTIPTLIVRFEDLRSNRVETLTKMFKFLLEVPSIEGTVVEARIKEISAISTASSAPYRLKSTSTSLSKNTKMYTPEQLELIKTQMRNFLIYFGYTNQPEGHQPYDDTTAFFKDIQFTDEEKKQFKGYTEHNREMMQKLCGEDSLPLVERPTYQMQGPDRYSGMPNPLTMRPVTDRLHFDDDVRDERRM